jgi:hypothetical protein
VTKRRSVARFVSCDLSNDKHALVFKAIAMFLQKAWGIRNAYKHGAPVVDVFESASERCGADGIDARAYKRGSRGGFIHASRAAGSILLSTSNICKHHMDRTMLQCCDT